MTKGSTLKAKKINEIKSLLKGDPRDKPWMIIGWPEDESNKNYTFSVTYNDGKKRPKKELSEAELEKLLKKYPDVTVLKVVWDSQKETRDTASDPQPVEGG